MTDSHTWSRPEAVNTDVHPHPHKCNTFNKCKPDTMDTESECDMEELYKPCEELGIPKHFITGSIKCHEHYNNMIDDEHSHLDTSSEDDISLMDSETTPVLTHTEHIATTPPIPHPRPLRTCPTPAQWSSKVKNKVTGCREATVGQCKTSHQAPPYPQTRKTPLLPTSPMPAQQQTKVTLISGPPQHNSNRYQYNSYISRPHRQWPPLLSSPPQRPNVTQGHFHLHVPLYLPMLVITLTDHFVNLLANQAACQTQLTLQAWSTWAY